MIVFLVFFFVFLGFLLSSSVFFLCLSRCYGTAETAGPSQHNGAQLMAPPEPLITIVLCWSEGFQGGSQLGSYDVETLVFLTLFFQFDRDVMYEEFQVGP